MSEVTIRRNRLRHTGAVTEEFDLVIDPDVDLADPAQVSRTGAIEWDLLAVISVGGILGSEARYALASAIPRHSGAFPWATLLTNVLGSVLIGALMVVVLEVLRPTRLLRPFLGVGILGGFTTFSTFGVENVRLVKEHAAGTAVLYVLASVLLCTLGTWLAITATTRLFVRR
jgi:CrcB protein